MNTRKMKCERINPLVIDYIVSFQEPLEFGRDTRIKLEDLIGTNEQIALAVADKSSPKTPVDSGKTPIDFISNGSRTR